MEICNGGFPRGGGELMAFEYSDLFSDICIVGGDQWSLTTYTPKPLRQYMWKPQVDITTYELALCLPIFSIQTCIVSAAIEELPAEARRHFEEMR